MLTFQALIKCIALKITVPADIHEFQQEKCDWGVYSGSQEITIHHTLALNIDRDGTKAWIT